MLFKYILIFAILSIQVFPQLQTSFLDINKSSAKIDFSIEEYSENIIKINIDIPEGHYTYIKSDIAFPISFSNDSLNIKTLYPKGEKIEGSEVLFGKQTITLQTTKPIENKDYQINILYQLCIKEDNICLPPVYETIIFSANSENFSDIKPINSSFLNEASKEDSIVGKIMNSHNMAITLILIFLAGFASTLLPCTYPLISVTISLLSPVKKNDEKIMMKKNILYSLFFALGIMTTYTLLGSIVALAGSLFQKTIQFGSLGYNPIVLSIIVLFFLYFTFSMAGFYDFSIPNSLHNLKAKAYSNNKNSVVTKYIMGLITGVVATPCAAPAVALILEVSLLNPRNSIIYMATYALGFSSVLFILGVFVSNMSKLPKAGSWTIYIRYAFTLVMLLVSFYYAQILFKTMNFEKLSVIMAIVTIFLFALIAYLITKQKSPLTKKELKIFLAVLIIGTIGSGIYNFNREISAHNHTPEVYSIEEAQALSRETGKKIFIDFSAIWCENCYKLKENVLHSATLEEIFEDNFIFLEVDIDKNKELASKFNVRWIPWVIVVDSDLNVIYTKNIFESFDKKTALEIKEDLLNIK